MKGVLTIGFAAALALAACGGSVAPASLAGSPTPPASKPAPASGAAKPSPSAAASAAASGGAAATGPIKIGDLLPLTGPQSSAGKDNEDG